VCIDPRDLNRAIKELYAQPLTMLWGWEFVKETCICHYQKRILGGGGGAI
jgi:hypothetical protein